MESEVLILGAGAAGLACRMALAGRREVVTLDAEPEIGGLLRMHHHGAWSFDTCVHTLFFRNPTTRQLVESLVPEGFHRFSKRNLVWQDGRVIDYPYQFHAHALAPEIRDDCLRHLPEGSYPARGPSFEDWLLAQFGEGFYRHFFEPYNRKLYGVSPAELEAAPMTWTIPSDNRAAVLRGAEGPVAQDQPQVDCLYPRGRGGISSLPARLAERGRGEILLGRRGVEIDPVLRTVHTEDGATFRYGELVCTLPLPVLLRCLRGVPAELARWGERFEARAISVLRIAIERSGGALQAQWTYFPDPDIPFYRLIRLEMLSPDLAPAGGSACLLEVGGSEVPDAAVAVDLCRRLGVAGDGAVECAGHVTIPYGYVLFRRGHRAASEDVIGALAEHGVRVAGRYATWSYFNIEQTLESGLRAAADVLSAG